LHTTVTLTTLSIHPLLEHCRCTKLHRSRRWPMFF